MVFPAATSLLLACVLRVCYWFCSFFTFLATIPRGDFASIDPVGTSVALFVPWPLSFGFLAKANF